MQWSLLLLEHWENLNLTAITITINWIQFGCCISIDCSYLQLPFSKKCKITLTYTDIDYWVNIEFVFTLIKRNKIQLRHDLFFSKYSMSLFVNMLFKAWPYVWNVDLIYFFSNLMLKSTDRTTAITLTYFLNSAHFDFVCVWTSTFFLLHHCYLS